ncbi:DUF72 domain-containing protein [Desulfogranum mediterraneum]|uniref:DUF72 domain-containing protein n=1 Tax=Desulfogranum mediterraneum TaxID=160661 RepID=UPI000402E882|nr:DUF72 domain-containing protein [Desulfogranum mediterraneum]
MPPALRIGTSGYSYPEWVDAGVYPPKTVSAAMLGLYSRMFPVVELNYSWYQMIRAEAVERMMARVPPAFSFAAKLTRTMTHEIGPDWQQQARLYAQGIRPLQQAGHLLAILAQFPPGFRRTPANRRYLALLLDLLAIQAGLPLVVEFRHRSWAHDRVFQGLSERGITLACVDTPPLAELFPCLEVVTNPKLCYFRLHGRNSAGWRSGTMQQQFNYSYTREELATFRDRLLLPMTAKASQGVVFFNNHVAGQAVANARTLTELLP